MADPHLDNDALRKEIETLRAVLKKDAGSNESTSSEKNFQELQQRIASLFEENILKQASDIHYLNLTDQNNPYQKSSHDRILTEDEFVATRLKAKAAELLKPLLELPLTNEQQQEVAKEINETAIKLAKDPDLVRPLKQQFAEFEVSLPDEKAGDHQINLAEAARIQQGFIREVFPSELEELKQKTKRNDYDEKDPVHGLTQMAADITQNRSRRIK